MVSPFCFFREQNYESIQSNGLLLPQNFKNMSEISSHVLMDSSYMFLNHSLSYPCKDWEKSLMQTSTCSTSKRSRKCSKACKFFFSCKVLGFSIKLRKVFLVFCRKIMKNMRQMKWFVLVWNIGRNRSMWDQCIVNFGFIRLTRMIFNVMWFKCKILIKIKCTR